MVDFLKSWGVTHNLSSPHYPQSNGKAEATVKSMKKLISSAWTGPGTFCHVPCYNTAILHAGRTVFLLLKSYLDILFRIHYQPIEDHLIQNGRSLLWALRILLHPHIRRWSLHTTSMHMTSPIHVGNHVALQNPISKLWDVYGVQVLVTFSHLPTKLL